MEAVNTTPAPSKTLNSPFNAPVCWPPQAIQQQAEPAPMIDPQPKRTLPNRRYYEPEFVGVMFHEAGIDPQHADPIEHWSRYWIARRYCGWDGMSATVRDAGPTPDGGRNLLDSMETPYWKWLKRLATYDLDELVDLSMVGRCPGCEPISQGKQPKRSAVVARRDNAILKIFAKAGYAKASEILDA